MGSEQNLMAFPVHQEAKEASSPSLQHFSDTAFCKRHVILTALDCDGNTFPRISVGFVSWSDKP